MNCHGCKWLDRYKKDGNGYCCMVERSKTQREKVRRPDMERCELYKPGDFSTRYRTEVNERKSSIQRNSAARRSPSTRRNWTL
jgi:hypothetical protein